MHLLECMEFITESYRLFVNFRQSEIDESTNYDENYLNEEAAFKSIYYVKSDLLYIIPR